MNEILKQKLQPPQGTINMVLDTDTFNEIDDQFALVYAAISPRINLKAVYAAPFHNERSLGPADGMERSYGEIIRVLSLLKYPHEGLVWKGSDQFMTAEKEAIESEAAYHLIRLAQETPAGEVLYVAAIGAITNIASALILEPTIKEKIVLVWLGGHPIYWGNNQEFNLMQDSFATQVVFDSGVPIVHIPCKNVAEHVKTSIPEMKVLFADKGAIGAYLYEIFADYIGDRFAASKEIWDITAIAWLLNPDTLPSLVVPRPILNLDANLSWSFDQTRPSYRVCTDAKRDLIFSEFVKALKDYVEGIS